ncbi:MAG: helix-turn-helix domain-containing protein [Verrucomicrobiales bacterium]|nr:helix-turn-helix domain-containing protein [Verrucomicrobiales bacterium]
MPDVMGSRLNRIKEEDWQRLAVDADFDPGNLAGLCFVSLKTLERHFVKELGKTPRDWIREFRCHLARRKVEEGFSDKAIVIDLKFTSTAQLCRQFKKVFGVSPQTFAPRPGTKSP